MRSPSATVDSEVELLGAVYTDTQAYNLAVFSVPSVSLSLSLSASLPVSLPVSVSVYLSVCLLTVSGIFFNCFWLLADRVGGGTVGSRLMM